MAAFGVGVLGLQAANKNLETIGNNVANSSTVGFKQSRAEFADLYAQSGLMFGGSKTGSGVKVADISQQFSQGGTTYTENSLDMMIEGNGFFSVKNPGNNEQLYTRAGTFGMDDQGYVVTNEGHRVQGYMSTDQTLAGIAGSGNQDLQIPVDKATAQATTEVKTMYNLDYSATAPVDNPDATPLVQLPFDKDDPDTYNYMYTTKIYDSKGFEHDLQQYFARDAGTANTWSMFTLVDGKNPDGTDVAAGALPNTESTLTFDDSGTLTDVDGNDPETTPVTVTGWTPSFPTGTAGTAAAPTPPAIDFTIDLSGTTEYAGDFSLDELSQDGYPAGDLSGLDVDDAGIIRAQYSNGQSDVIGQVAVATFRNDQGLTPVGGTSWRQSSESGAPVINQAGAGASGTIESRALEDSNVDLSEELVKMIIAQRDYQANAKTIQAADQLTQTIINMR